jgi:hypothetical protein
MLASRLCFYPAIHLLILNTHSIRYFLWLDASVITRGLDP